MQYILIILINLLAINFWLWLFQSMFHRKRNKRMILILLIVMWGISSLAMLVYPELLSYISAKTFSPAVISWQGIVLLICYLGAIGLLLTFFGKKISFRHKLFIRSIWFITLAVCIALGVITLPMWIILYLLCVAGAEEFLKLSVGQSFFAQYWLHKKDLLLFAILSALGFALIENIVYLLHTPSVGLAVSRSLITVVMHVIFTGLIAYIVVTRAEKHAGRYIIAFLVGMALHRGYNSFISYQNPFITTAMIIIGYFVVSYFLYKSDRLYLSK